VNERKINSLPNAFNQLFQFRSTLTLLFPPFHHFITPLIPTSTFHYNFSYLYFTEPGDVLNNGSSIYHQLPHYSPTMLLSTSMSTSQFSLEILIRKTEMVKNDGRNNNLNGSLTASSLSSFCNSFRCDVTNESRKL